MITTNANKIMRKNLFNTINGKEDYEKIVTFRKEVDFVESGVINLEFEKHKINDNIIEVHQYLSIFTCFDAIEFNASCIFSKESDTFQGCRIRKLEHYRALQKLFNEFKQFTEMLKQQAQSSETYQKRVFLNEDFVDTSYFACLVAHDYFFFEIQHDDKKFSIHSNVDSLPAERSDPFDAVLKINAAFCEFDEMLNLMIEQESDLQSK